jgi:hypothetical protein
MERRKEPRLTIEIPVTFTAESVEQKGRVTSLSMGGLRVASFPPVQPGIPLKLNVHLPGNDTPLEVELATVRWSQDGEFGMSTVILGEESRNRLRDFLGNSFQLDAVVLETRSGSDAGLVRDDLLNSLPTPAQDEGLCSARQKDNLSSAMSQGNGAERRRLKRMRVGFPIRMVGDLMNKKGLVVDLSLGGCGIEGHEGLKDAKYLGLVLSPPGSDEPIKVELAAVRWVGDQQAGLEFVRMKPAERERLQALLKGLDMAPGPQAA